MTNRSAQIARRTFVLIQIWILAAHGLITGLAYRMLPWGFPAFHRRFIANQLIAPALLVASLALLFVLVRNPNRASAWLSLYPAIWLGIALSLFITFPVSGGEVAKIAFLGALTLGIAWWLFRRTFPAPRNHVLAASSLGLLLGATLPLSQRSGPAGTRPSFAKPPPSLSARAPAVDFGTTYELRSDVHLNPIDLELSIALQHITLTLRPLLEFDGLAPDGFWTIIHRNEPLPWIGESVAREPEGRWLFSATPHKAWLQANTPADSNVTQVIGWTQLDALAYSHLNSFSQLTIRGHQRLGIAFSPCAQHIIEVKHADYPQGAPARFAYVDSTHAFRVVEAKDAEKGPYRMLAEGKLTPNEPALSISVYELADKPARLLAKVTFADWARQLSTQLSPTAGYGVAENAIEFGLHSVEPSSLAHISLTLAATGVGRGWDSVAHAPGVYRNEVTIQAGSR
ncbi:MAG: hypothetical protein ACOY0T_33715 [Myxococcota bacterium]